MLLACAGCRLLPRTAGLCRSARVGGWFCGRFVLCLGNCSQKASLRDLLGSNTVESVSGDSAFRFRVYGDECRRALSALWGTALPDAN